LCDENGVEIIGAESCQGHIHMLLSIPPKYSISTFVGFLKGKGGLVIFDRHSHLKYKYDSRTFRAGWILGGYSRA
jgi:putative transposase